MQRLPGRLLCFLSCRHKKGRPPAGVGPVKTGPYGDAEQIVKLQFARLTGEIDMRKIG